MELPCPDPACHVQTGQALWFPVSLNWAVLCHPPLTLFFFVQTELQSLVPAYKTVSGVFSLLSRVDPQGPSSEDGEGGRGVLAALRRVLQSPLPVVRTDIFRLREAHKHPTSFSVTKSYQHPLQSLPGVSVVLLGLNILQTGVRAHYTCIVMARYSLPSPLPLLLSTQWASRYKSQPQHTSLHLFSWASAWLKAWCLATGTDNDSHQEGHLVSGPGEGLGRFGLKKAYSIQHLA